MNYIYFLFVFIVFGSAFQISCASFAQQQLQAQNKVERKPFQKSPYVIQQPKKPTKEELEVDGVSDPKSRVVVIDEKAGKYEFRWLGVDGKEKSISYQRHDAIDGSIEATVERIEGNRFLYKYLIKISLSSQTRLLNFVVYTLTSKVKPIEQEKVQSGLRYPLIAVEDNYLWLSYYPMHERGLFVDGGKSLEVQAESPSPSGIIRYWVSGGELGTKGIGEDLPPELERAIPIFQDLAWGYTIGPVENLSSLSKSERAKYLLDNLPKFLEAGWMSEGTAKNYESLFKREDLKGALEKAKKDLEQEFITAEVFHIIEGLNQ